MKFQEAKRLSNKIWWIPVLLSLFSCGVLHSVVVTVASKTPGGESLFIGVLNLTMLAVPPLLFCAAFYITRSFAIISHGTLGYIPGGRPPILKPGVRWAGFNTKVLEVPAQPISGTVSHVVRLPDTMQVKVTVPYTVKIIPERIDRIEGFDVDGFMRERIAGFLSKYAASPTEGPQTWQDAFSAHDDFRTALWKELWGEEHRKSRAWRSNMHSLERQHQPHKIDEYGLELTRLDVLDIEAAGDLLKYDIQSLLARTNNFKRRLANLRGRITNMADLDREEKQLRAEYPPEKYPDMQEAINDFVRIERTNLSDPTQ